MKGRTVFHNFEFVYNSPIKFSFKKKYLLIKLYHIILKTMYSLPIEVRMSTISSYMLCLKSNYIKKESFKYINDKKKYYDITINMYKNYSFDHSKIDNLFIAQTFTNNSIVDKDKIKKLLPILNNSKISLKNHPKLNNVMGLENCEIIPEYLPVELFFQKVNNNIISFYSASLITASMFDNIKAISLIDLIKTEDPFLYDVKEDLIGKSRNKILFPQTLSELTNLLYA